MRRLIAALAFASVFLSVLATNAVAQETNWPTKTVQIVVSTPPGSGQDTLGRFLAEGLQKSLNQSFVVLNVPGAGSVASAAKVFASPADGYTILIANSAPMGIAKTLRNDLPYDPLKDFIPVSQLTSSYFLVVTNPGQIPAKTLPELITTLKATPGKYNYGSSGIGGIIHMQNELFMLRTGTKVTHIPYKSAGEVSNALLAGFVDMAVNTTADVVSQIKAAQLRGLAVTADTRLSELPDVPTMKEILPAYGDAQVWQGAFVRAGTPRAIVEKLNKAIVAYMQSPEAERLKSLGLTPSPSSPE